MTGSTLTTVVVGYDGSAPSERALERAATLVGTGGRVIVVTARPSLAPSGISSEPILDTPPSDERGAMLERSRVLLNEPESRRRSSRPTTTPRRPSPRRHVTKMPS